VLRELDEAIASVRSRTDEVYRSLDTFPRTGAEPSKIDALLEDKVAAALTALDHAERVAERVVLMTGRLLVASRVVSEVQGRGERLRREIDPSRTPVLARRLELALSQLAGATSALETVDIDEVMRLVHLANLDLTGIECQLAAAR
jgi:hypothetical protein